MLAPSDPPRVGGAGYASPTAVLARWEVRLGRAVMVSDLAAVLASVLLRDWWGQTPSKPYVSTLLAAAAVLGLMACLAATRAWDPRVLGHGPEEFSRLIRAMATATVAMALLGLALQMPEFRPWVFGVIPMAGLFAALGRMALRGRLRRRRSRGLCTHTVLAVGAERAVADLIRRTRRDRNTGWTVAAVCTPTGLGRAGTDEVLGVPVLGDLDSAVAVLRERRFRVLSIAPAPGFSSRRLHQLAWDIEGTGAELVVDPGLMEVAGPRLHVTPVDGLPLLRLTAPDFAGVPWFVKTAADRLGAALLLLALAPLLAAIACAVKLDGGPVFFRQTRVGRHGAHFRIIKFRSMRPDAERHKAGLTNDAHGPLFKLRSDPRCTRVGRVLRRYSLDELPQLVNVLTGSMSLVGPRPPLPEEVNRYSRDAWRRLLVRPGLTGLWQVSGRSDLSWEQSVRLDLRYVENWTLALDAVILSKTIGAVVRGNGAY